MKIVSRILALSIAFMILSARAEMAQKPFFTVQQEQFLSENIPVYAYFAQLYVEEKTPQQIAKEYGLSVETSQKYLKALEDIGVIKKTKERDLSSLPQFLVTGISTYSAEGPLSRAFTELMLKDYHEKFMTSAGEKNTQIYLSTPGLWLTEKDYQDLQKDFNALEEKYIRLSLKNRKSKNKKAFRVSSFVGLIPKWEPGLFQDIKKDY